MTVYAFGKRSEENLIGVHPDLVRLMRLSIKMSLQDFMIIDGLRTIEEEQKNLANGASQTLNSMHLKRADGWGHAVDVVAWKDGKASFESQLFYPIAEAIKKASELWNIPVIWGGDWHTFKDLGHFELDRNEYPG